MVGVGQRGTTLLRTLLTIEGVEVNALADITPGNLAHAQHLVEKSQGKRPEGYGNGPEHFRKLVLREDIDAVIGATPPDWHSSIAVAAMKAKKYAATEVPAALSLEQCWELVNTYEATGTPCMMLENVCNFRDTLMVLNMVRQGLLGELIHCEAGYQHDCRALSFDENGNFSEGKFAPSEGGPHYQVWATTLCSTSQWQSLPNASDRTCCTVPEHQSRRPLQPFGLHEQQVSRAESLDQG